LKPVRDKEKISRVRRIMRREGIDALVSHVPENLTYLSGAWCGRGLSFVVYPLDRDPILILPTGETYPESWVSDIKWYTHETFQHTGNVLDFAGEKIKQALAELGVPSSGTIGIENAWNLFLATPMRYELNVIDGSALGRRLPGYLLKDSSPLLIETRSIKTPLEIAALKKTSEIAQVGLQTFQDGLKPKIAEIELSAEIEYDIVTEAITQRRASQVVACAFVASGPLTAEGYKHVVGNTKRKLRPNDLVMLELDVTVDGYSSDTTRTFVVGRPNRKQKKLFDAVLDSQKTAISAIRPSVRAAEVARVSNDIITKHGFSDYLVHRLGHGIGVSAHEPIPALHVESSDILLPGMVHSVEPGIYGKRIGGVRIEDVVLDTETGAQYLSEFPRIPE
jgi:Xaa-Pro dipeptidase